jgi:hypothetical protein
MTPIFLVGNISVTQPVGWPAVSTAQDMRFWQGDSNKPTIQIRAVSIMSENPRLSFRPQRHCKNGSNKNHNRCCNRFSYNVKVRKVIYIFIQNIKYVEKFQLYIPSSVSNIYVTEDWSRYMFIVSSNMVAP